MPQIKYEFVATGADEVLASIRRIRASHPGMAWPPVNTPALAEAMATVGPEAEWSWLDYLSVGDALRVMRLLEIRSAVGCVPYDVARAALAALTELRRVAEERMAAANAPPQKAD